MVKKAFDYKKLGFKAGIEIHAQLSTKKKLFCHCPASLTNEEAQAVVQRRFRPVLGEMGKYDPALLIEFEKGHTIFYEVFDSICTYELDETPPFPINTEALYDGIKLARMVNCQIVTETNVCRKNYLDGSVTSGFQRTALIGYDGYISLKKEFSSLEGKKLPITWIYIEEDAARKDNERSGDKEIFFKLDRLGIPLIEIVTDHNLYSPTEVVSAARSLGMLIKSSGLARKGLGTIRQDINVSISKGDRVELKGIQLLKLIPDAIDLEIQRQLGLISIQEELQKRNIHPKDIPLQILNITEIFFKTSSKIVQSALKRKEEVFLFPITGFKGLLGRELQPNKRFGTELSERVKSFTDLKGIIHSDEDLTRYNFSVSEIHELSEFCREDNLAYVIAIGKKDKAHKALNFVHERIIAAFQGVHPETRHVDEEGISTFTRDLHGRSRLYPDTDLLPIVVDSDRVKEIDKNLPPNLWDKIQQLSKEYSISRKLAENLIYDNKDQIFVELMQKGAPIKVVVTTLTQTLTTISREGVDIDNITKFHLIDIFEALKSKQIAKEAIPEILVQLGTDPTKSTAKIISKFGYLSLKELDELIITVLQRTQNLIKERKMDAFSPLMGIIMKEVRGKIDGKIISERLRKYLEEQISQNVRGEN
ncbi:MAG: Glu-tRNA(Gln) amidotransferase subunit GatE [Candidatus Heimdallarchaeota archaeon]|nr:MAG: Glu-tRNA(Gln) amidotransferase subunit GatE [Candidatus Heimdallarchaeota archaeon]